MTNKSVVIIGAGVSGLSTGILLQEAGYQVEIWAKDVPPNTTSDVAAAFWYPYLCSPRDKAIVWSKFSREYLTQHAVTDPASGCVLRTFTELFEHKVDEPWWRDAVEAYRRPEVSELPPGYVDAYQTDVVLMASHQYMTWLVTRFVEAGGRIRIHEIEDFTQALEQSPVVVNCTGLGAAKLCSDERLYPVRGQILRIKDNGYNNLYVSDSESHGLVHITPRITDIVIGGVSQPGNDSLEVSDEDTAGILQRVAKLAPEFTDVEILEIKVGLRPARDEVRLEAEEFLTGTVIHNYGHGGAGYTLSWGCAKDAVDLVEQHFSQS